MQRPKGMCRNTTEQCPRPLCSEDPGERRRGEHRGQPEPGQRERMVGHSQQRTHDVLGELIEIRRRPSEDRLPPRTVAAEAGGGVIE